MTSKLILGTVQFGLEYGINNKTGKPDSRSIAEILELAYEQGIRILDSAEAYGTAHQEIGLYHRSSSNRFKVISKFDSKSTESPKRLKDRIETNLETLGIEALHGYMFHSFSDYEKLYPSLRKEIEDLKTQGLIIHFGVSVYTNPELEKVLEEGTVNFVQLPFNVLDNNQLRGNLISRAKEKGVEVHTRSAFLQGLLFADLEGFSPQLSALRPAIQQFREIADNEGISNQELALSYCLKQSKIDQVLIGVDTKLQLTQNLKAAETQISSETMEQIERIMIDDPKLLNPSNWIK